MRGQDRGPNLWGRTLGPAVSARHHQRIHGVKKALQFVVHLAPVEKENGPHPGKGQPLGSVQG